jgi:hypothetical protein
MIWQDNERIKPNLGVTNMPEEKKTPETKGDKIEKKKVAVSAYEKHLKSQEDFFNEIIDEKLEPMREEIKAEIDKLKNELIPKIEAERTALQQLSQETKKGFDEKANENMAKLNSVIEGEKGEKDSFKKEILSIQDGIQKKFSRMDRSLNTIIENMRGTVKNLDSLTNI